ncbi:MAG: TPM domain-containing protein [Eubacteriaceae bacterium]|jgi:uncharacterized protein|nr:TPM domain-containing protein [Eubacteriaceae bacterium]
MKKYFALLAALSLLCLFASSAFAATFSGFNATLPRVVDNARQLDDSQERELSTKLLAIVEEYKVDLAILTVWDTQGKSDEEYADDYFDFNGYGAGDEGHGALLLVNMGGRTWHLSTYRNAELYFRDSIDSIMAEALPYLSDGDAYQAFNIFAESARSILQAGLDNDYSDYFGENGQPIGDGYENAQPNWTDRLPIVFGASAILSVACVLILRGSMNTARPQPYAGSYIRSESFVLNSSQDIFLYSNVTKVRKQTDEDRSGGGGGGFHTSSSGRSHGGHGGSF